MNGERERLVELLKQNCHCKDEDCSNCSSNGICFTYREADYLLDNSVIVPPVKVGQKVYDTSEGFIEPCTVGVIFLGDYEDIDGNRSHMAELHFDREDCPYATEEIYFTDIGKTVFLTKEEAEKALEGGAV